MSTSDSNKSETIAKFQRGANDTGSPEVQIALCTKRLQELSGHFEKHREDTHSRRGMFRLIAQRKRLLEYLKRENIERYRSTIAALGLRK